MWQIYRGSDTYIQTYDHTLKTLSGHYYALDFRTIFIENLQATFNYKMLSKWFPPTTSACITFSYYVTAVKWNDSLNFHMRKENTIGDESIELWRTTGDSGPFWYSHRLTVNSTLKWQFGFDVSTHNTDTGLIAIDDVFVQLGKQCPPKGRCDFEVRFLLF